MLRAVFVAAALLLCGCASAIMKDYVGRTIADVMMDYGPPQTAFDLTPTQRAFMWSMTTSFVTPSTTNVTGTAYGSLFSATAISTPSQVVSQQCNYTLIAERIAGAVEGPAGWRVVSFCKPSLMCE
jgi:hypothetical protein